MTSAHYAAWVTPTMTSHGAARLQQAGQPKVFSGKVAVLVRVAVVEV